jgi:hypothetical protein
VGEQEIASGQKGSSGIGHGSPDVMGGASGFCLNCAWGKNAWLAGITDG